jgi:hypothetical protein
VYYAHPMFRDYARRASAYTKRMVLDGLERLMGERLVVTNLPSTARLTVRRGPGRYVVQVLHYVAEQRSQRVPTIEEGLDVVDVRLELNVAEPVTGARLWPKGKELAVERLGGVARVSAPHIKGRGWIEVRCAEEGE